MFFKHVLAIITCMTKYKRKYKIKTDFGTFEIVLKSDDGERGYTVKVPKLPEIVTEGRTIEDAKKMAREAIGLCIESQKDEHYTNSKSKGYSSNITSSRL